MFFFWKIYFTVYFWITRIFRKEDCYLVWLDDLRNPSKNGWLATYAPEYKDDKGHVVWVKNFDQFRAFIETHGLPEKICFDHDLGPGKTGYDCAHYLVNYCMDHQAKLPRYEIHSANPVGTKNITKLLENFKKFFK